MKAFELKIKYWTIWSKITVLQLFTIML